MLFCIPLISFAQISLGIKGQTIKKISDNKIEIGTPVELLGVVKNEINGNSILLKVNDRNYLIDYSDLEKITLTPSNIKEFWQKQALQYSVYSNVVNIGIQYKLRKELEEEALDYLTQIESSNLVFNDSYLESYLYTVVNKIYPFKLDDGRPGIVNLKILKDINPNSFIFPNGSLVITTGLLSTINSEDELVGILAHEISHFVLDHQISNVNKAVQRQKRAEFWATVATGLAAAADIYIASKNRYYTPGILTMNTAILAYSISESVNDRLGLKYSVEQEFEADKCAFELMNFIKIDPKAISSALKKIVNIQSPFFHI